MSRLWIFLGFFLIAFAIVFLLMTIFAPDTEPLYSIIQSIGCTSNEELVIERERWALPNGERGENVRFFCEIEPGQQRSVTDNVMPLFIVLFIAPLLFGILSLMRGVVGSTTPNWKNQVQSQMDMWENSSTTSSTVIDVSKNRDQIPPETAELINSMLGGLATSFTQGAGRGTLTERLQQLQDAYDNGLISKEEYDRVRQSILDSMDD